MPNEQTDGWPRFQIVTYSQPTGIPNGWDAELVEKGAPDGLVCEAMKELTVLEDPGLGPLVCFGTLSRHVYACLDPRTKQVLDIVYKAARPGNPQPRVIRSAWLVNSSLDQFIASVRAVTARFQYDSWRHDEVLTFNDRLEEWAYQDKLFEEWDNACREMNDMLRMIDFAAVANPDGFWMMFIADVQMGNYSTEDILSPPEC